MKELIPILKTFEEHVHIFHLKHDNLSNTMIVHFWWLLWEVHNKLNIGVLSVVLPNQLKTTTTIIITVIIYIYIYLKKNQVPETLPNRIAPFRPTGLPKNFKQHKQQPDNQRNVTNWHSMLAQRSKHGNQMGLLGKYSF